MKKNNNLTYRRIQMMAYEIAHGLMKRGINDTRIYYNNRAIEVSFNHKAWLNDIDNTPEKFCKLIKYTNISPLTYFEYAASNHILSMSFEGELYDWFYNNGCPEWLEKIFDKYGVYCELGDNWNLTCYPKDDNTKVDYTWYTPINKKKYLVLYQLENESSMNPDRAIFLPIMREWYNRSKKTGDIGSCVLGAGMKFNYNGTEYFMNPCSPWQGSCSWEAHTDWVKKELEKIGCTDVYYDCGHLD